MNPALMSSLAGSSFNISDMSNAGGVSGYIDMLGEMGKTGQVKFAPKNTYINYLLIGGFILILFKGLSK